MSEQTVIERAFELARGGVYRSVDEITRTLKSEGYGSVENHLSGPSLRKQLRAIIVESKN